MTAKTLVRTVAIAALLSGGWTLAHADSAWAQAAAKPAISAGKTAMTPDEKRAKSKECSAKADAQHLHGKARKAFRAKCKRGES
jgi:hypothetical protein